MEPARKRGPKSRAFRYLPRHEHMGSWFSIIFVGAFAAAILAAHKLGEQTLAMGYLVGLFLLMALIGWWVVGMVVWRLDKIIDLLERRTDRGDTNTGYL